MTLRQQFESGVAHHQAGRVAEAERIYRLVLAEQPNHADALHLLGVLAGQAGRPAAARDLILRAITISSTNASYHCNLGRALADLGQLEEAVAAYRQATRLQPDYTDAHNNLGIVLKNIGRLDDAIASYRKAVALNPDLAETHHNLGIAFAEKGRHEEAIASYRQAIRLKPGHAEAHYNLGVALKAVGQLDEAVASYRQAIRLKSDYAEAHNNLGIALKGMGKPDDAIACYRKAIQLKPGYAKFHNNLGNVLSDKGQFDEAISSYRRSIALNPDSAEAHNNLGGALIAEAQLDEAIEVYRRSIFLKPAFAEAHINLGSALTANGQLSEAIVCLRQAILLRPDYADAYGHLGIVLRETAQFDEAIASYRKAIELKPVYPEAHNNLGNALKDTGQLDDAIACYRQAMLLKPDFAAAHSNLLYIQLFHPGYDAGMISQEHRRWSDRFAQPLETLIGSHPNHRDPDRQLRVGYLSPDFREHCQSLFTVPLLSNHDRKSFKIFCYADVKRPDKTTERLRGCVDVWRPVAGMTDAELARTISKDQIDILVDLTMHMAEGRPQVLARKPAPVQVAWLAYPGTTGLKAIDCRLTDPYLDPPGLNDQFYSETTVRLPATFWCYDPLSAGPDVNALPAQSHGYITFGCLNNFCKVNDQVLKLWAQVLKAVDRSRLTILCPKGSHRQLLLDKLKSEGIDPDRIELVIHRPRAQYLELYHQIDVALDTFPYNGHTTSLDSFWMGVPVITLVGRTVVGRAGLSQLTNLRLPDLIAYTSEQYAQIARDLAGDLARLAELRRTLRPLMQASPLMDASRFVRDIEGAYRQMWREWCATKGSS